MFITRTPETRHIGIDLKALKAFLLEQQFAPAFLDDLNVVVVPVSCEKELDDEAFEALSIGWANAWIYAKDASLKLMNKQLLAAIRMQVYDCEQLDAAEETLRTWGIDPATLTFNEIADDCLSFAVRNYEAQQFVFPGGLAHYPLYETDRRCSARHRPFVPQLIVVPQQTTPEPVKVHPIIAMTIAVCVRSSDVWPGVC